VVKRTSRLTTNQETGGSSPSGSAQARLAQWESTWSTPRGRRSDSFAEHGGYSSIGRAPGGDPGGCQFDPGQSPQASVAQWIARVVPNHEVGRSNRPEDTARDSPGERRSAKPPDGFDSRRVSTARRPRDQGSGVLNRQCAFESRRADGGAHVYGTTEYSFPVRIWLVLRNQSEKLTMRVQVPLPARALISGRSHGSWPCLVRRWGVLRLISGGCWFESNHWPRPV
jgi:hypothetical protein